jgi:hypothetical protein
VLSRPSPHHAATTRTKEEENGKMAMTMLGDEMLSAVSGGHGKHKGKGYYKRVEQNATVDQSEVFDFSGATITIKGNGSFSVSGGDDTATVTQSA